VNIVAELPEFTRHFGSLTYSRGAVVTACLRYIERISIDTPNARLSPCSHVANLYFAYNRVCKVYFFHDPDTDGVTLAEFTFANFDGEDF
jgi:hypothetical protein